MSSRDVLLGFIAPSQAERMSPLHHSHNWNVVYCRDSSGTMCGKDYLDLLAYREPASYSVATLTCKIESAVRYLRIEVDDASGISEQTEILNVRYVSADLQI